MTRPQNWVFLGDSLTEGLGSSRATYVTELVKLLRSPSGGARLVHDMRLRGVDPDGFNPYIRTNLAGYLDEDSSRPSSGDQALWVWNLASEGQTIDSDVRWVPLLRNLAPERVFIYRGSLESIIRPSAVRDGAWPAWLPRSWRGFFAMDPRCYFSATWYRYAKQAGIDALKQRVRLRLLAERPGCPMMDPEVILSHYRHLLLELRALGTTVHVLGLIAPEDDQFPGSAAHFNALNDRLRALASEMGADFIDWSRAVAVTAGSSTWRYRDGFHPHLEGAQMLAAILHERLTGESR